MDNGSAKMLGFYRIQRGPRPNFLPYLEREYFKVDGEKNIENSINHFIKDKVHVPRGIALPFSMQQKFLESSPAIQQLIGKLRNGFRTKSDQIDGICFKITKCD